MPSDLGGQLGSAFDAFVSSAIVQLFVTAFVFYLFIVWLAAAFWAFRDMQLRSDNPILPYIAATLIVLFTPLLFPFGVVVYRIIRPQEKIGEVYERNLAEEALLAEVVAQGFAQLGAALREAAFRRKPAPGRSLGPQQEHGHADAMLHPGSRSPMKQVTDKPVSVRAHRHQVAAFLLNIFDDFAGRIAVRQGGLGGNAG